MATSSPRKAGSAAVGWGWLVTSLPELVTGLSAVTVAHVPDIAVGDIMGSCVFNLLLVVHLLNLWFLCLHD
jgi:cation:H+ antiporter